MGTTQHANKLAVTTIVWSTFAVIVWILACAETQPLIMPTSHWQGGYNFTWNPPQNAPVRSMRVTMAVVSPSFAQQNEFATKHDTLAKGFTRSLATDFDKILIAKGMTVTGPYESLDMMTYPDKKNADLSLTPDVVLNATVIEGQWTRNGNNFVQPIQVTMDGSVTLVLREPLSSEKIWIKKIPLQGVTKTGQVIARQQTVVVQPGQALDLTGRNKVSLLELMAAAPQTENQPGDIIVDGVEEAMADCIQDLYKPIMDSTWDFINGEEIKVLKGKAAEVRKLKRY
jgi:hypothetical protein